MHRFNFRGTNRYGAPVRQTIEAGSIDEARELLRQQGFRVDSISEEIAWHRSPAFWGLLIVAAAALAVVLIVAPLVGILCAVLIVIVLSGIWEGRRRQRHHDEQRQLHIAASQAERSQLEQLAARRRQEEIALNLAVQRIVMQLQTKRAEESETLLELTEYEATMPDLGEHRKLREMLEAKRAEIRALEAELGRLNGQPDAAATA